MNKVKFKFNNNVKYSLTYKWELKKYNKYQK